MKEFNGTPGPWTGKDMFRGVVLSGDGLSLSCGFASEEAKANGKLALAAPDLLEACLRARNQFYAAGYEPKAGSMNPVECLLAQLIAAISKALGEE
ncbi:hypothetical protein LWT57_12400 [Enterobacter cloacae]|uniref:hypothetical protein n=1 Tax=Enterobacter cloacae TaxID=550 RepID=UPI001E5EED90|nr:hypothetical protein [Enterobacter cloacae]MCE1970813.1 hypothetical protein [Enterobacter cloacae]